MKEVVQVMFEEEEKKLLHFKRQIDDKKIPQDLIDDSILQGFHKAKRGRSFQRRPIFFIAAIFLFLVGCVATVWIVSPELLNDNKGLKHAIEHEYYQEINVSQKKNGMEIILKGAIVDEKSFVLFYDIRTDEKFVEVDMNNLEVTDIQGNEIDWSSSTYGTPNYSEKGAKKFEGKWEMFSIEKLPTFNFVASFQLEGKSVNGVEKNVATFTVPFSLDEKEIAAKKVYEMGDVVEIDGQRMTFEHITIYPIRAEISILIDDDNSKALLDFPDLKIVDEHGEEWGKIMNGINATYPDENEQIIYMQSNYFKQPEELYVVLQEIQAIDKTEQDVVVDLETEKIVQQPASMKFVDFVVVGNGLNFKLQHEEEFPFGPFAIVKDESGNELEVISSSYSQRGDGLAEYSVQVENLGKQTGKVHLPLSFYPEWISVPNEIKLKIK